MRSWFLLAKMIFDFFKRLFGIVDEGSRKRRADDIDNDFATSIVSSKKHCCDREVIRANRVIYANENEAEDIEFLGDTHYSPVRSKERLNGTSCTKRKQTATYQKPIQTYRKNSVSQMNGRDKTRSNSFSFKSMAAMSESKYSTLTKTNQLREKQEYGQLLQRFLPQKSYAIRAKTRDEESKKRQVTTEVIDLEKYETPVKSVSESRKQTRDVFSTPTTSTPLRWYTPSETRNNEPLVYRTKDDEVSVLSVERTLKARDKNDGVSILKIRTTNEKFVTPISKIGTPISKIVPTIHPVKDVSKTPSPRETPIEQASTSKIQSRTYAEIIQTNTLRDNLAAKAVIKQDFVPRISDHYKERLEQRMKEAEELKRMTCLLSKHNRLAREAALEEQLTRSMRLCEAVLEETEELEEAALPELTPFMLQEIKQALIPNPPNEILVEKFGLRVTRKDIYTLSGLNWLNDEVINFYMNLLIVRGTNNDEYPKVHAMNTFFYPKLLSGGHASLKRWTRKIDVFAQDILVVPIHLGIHWCMSIVDFREKIIRYFDSMGGSNPKCLVTLRKYLEDESMDKKKKSFDSNDWKLESMKNIPQQMNGSDCGVFSCMFAEFITANRKITFTQQDMPYFRNKMVYEILKAKLL